MSPAKRKVRKPAPEVQAEREAIPIARRLAGEAEALRESLPLLWGRGDETRRMPMVGWFDPAQLLRTGFKTVVSILVGQRSDQRIVQALLSRENEIYALTLWVFFLVFVFVFFTDTRSRIYRWLGGLAHAGAHWFSMLWIGLGAMVVVNRLFPAWPIARFALGAALVMAAGWIVGSMVMGLYLLVSLNVFGRHSGHAFSALRIQDFKHFLRLHVEGDGTLTIYPVKIERVPRRWSARSEPRSGTHSRVVPEEPLRLELIEPPIVLGR